MTNNSSGSLQWTDTGISIFIKYVQCKNCKSNYTKTPTKCDCDKPYDFEELDLYLNKVQEGEQDG